MLSVYGSKASNVKVLNDTKVSYEVSTDHAKKQYTLKMIMIAAHEGKYKKTNTTAVEIYQCWKDGVAASSSTGLKGMSCHVFQAIVGSADDKLTVLFKMY